MTCFYVSLDFVHKIMDEKFFCLIIIAVRYGPWCPANRESWYVFKIMGSYFSGITNRNKLPLSKSIISHVCPEQKVIDNNIIKCLGSNTILCFDTGWEFSISYVLINVMKMSGMLLHFYEVLCLDW